VDRQRHHGSARLKGQAMLRRNIGRVSITHLKQLPESMDARAI
jgi:hypothetical protein